MTPAGEERLAGFVRSIVRRGSVPRAAADDVAEELLGHLLERAQATIAAGVAEADAVEQSIAGFGDPAELGDELGRTFHSRLWLATIGVLLAAGDHDPHPSGAIRALRVLLGLEAVLVGAGGVAALLIATPVIAVLESSAAVAFVAALVVAYRGLALGRAWALTFGVAVAFLTLGAGVLEVVTAPADTTIIPVGAIASGLILLGLASSWDRVNRFVSADPPIGARLGTVLSAALIGPVVIALAIPSLSDPTQAAGGDVDMRLAMTCGRRDLQMPDGPLLRDRQHASLVVDLSWRRTDVLPFGIGALFGSTAGGDTAGFRVLDPPPIAIDGGGGMPTWMLDPEPPSVVVAETGDTAGWFGSTSPSVDLIPDTMGSFTVGIETDKIAAGRTTRIIWSIGPTQDGTQPWPTVEVAYAHLDRFLLIGQVSCGQTTRGSVDQLPAPEQPRFLP